MESQVRVKELFEPLIQTFRERASYLRRGAFVNLLIIVMLLIIGIGVFILAGALAGKGSSQVATKERQAILDYLKARRLSLQQDISKLQNEIKETSAIMTAEEIGRQMEGRTGRPGRGPVYNSMNEKLALLNTQNASLKEELKKLDEQEGNLQTDIANAEEQTADQNQVRFLVSAVTTRVGSIVLLLFLVKILVPLYRHNIKLASYYDARADALELIIISGSEDRIVNMFEKFTTILTPANVDFSAPPASPADQVIDFAKHVIETQKAK
jgi:predicted PurR-regulated permease PerM